MQQLSFIYLLHDNGKPLYIGTTKGLTKRYIEHHNTLYADKAKGEALYSLLLDNRMCDIKVLAVCHPAINRALEHQFIVHYKKIGIPISNTLGSREDTRREGSFFKKIAFRGKDFAYYIKRVEVKEKSMIFFYSHKLLNSNDFYLNFTTHNIIL